MKNKRKTLQKKREQQRAAEVMQTRVSRRRWLWLALGGAAIAGVGAGGVWLANYMSGITEYTYQIVNRFPHKTDAFTQGLVWENGFLYEGTGGKGESEVRRVDLRTGDVVDSSQRLPGHQFGEGIAIWEDKIIQLTWRSGKGYVYDKRNLRRLRDFDYDDQGWGLTHDGEKLIVSDGSEYLRFFDPQSFEEQGRVEVRWSGHVVKELNELEYINGEVYANVWHQDVILRIAPNSGNVVGVLNLTGLRPAETRFDAERVLNGIAYDAENDRLFVTGKRWPYLFEIRQLPASA